jgi:hypothetical protein
LNASFLMLRRAASTASFGSVNRSMAAKVDGVAVGRARVTGVGGEQRIAAWMPGNDPAPRRCTLFPEMRG